MFNGHFMYLNILSNIEALHIDIFTSTVTLIILIGSTLQCVWNGRKGSEGNRQEDKKESFLHLDDRGEKKRKKLEGCQISLAYFSVETGRKVQNEKRAYERTMSNLQQYERTMSTLKFKPIFNTLPSPFSLQNASGIIHQWQKLTTQLESFSFKASKITIFFSFFRLSWEKESCYILISLVPIICLQALDRV